MDDAAKTPLIKTTDVKTWLRTVALHLLKEHGDESPLDLGTRESDQGIVMCVGGLIELVERLEARIEVLEDQLRGYSSHLDACRDKAQHVAEMLGDLNNEPEGCIRHRLMQVEERVAWMGRR